MGANWASTLGAGLLGGLDVYQRRTRDDDAQALERARDARAAEAQRVQLALAQRNADLDERQFTASQDAQKFSRANVIREMLGGQRVDEDTAHFMQDAGMGGALDVRESRLPSTPFQLGTNGQLTQGPSDPGQIGGTFMRMPLKDSLAVQAAQSQIGTAEQQAAARAFVQSPEFAKLGFDQRDLVMKLAGLGGAEHSEAEDLATENRRHQQEMEKYNFIYRTERFGNRGTGANSGANFNTKEFNDLFTTIYGKMAAEQIAAINNGTLDPKNIKSSAQLAEEARAAAQVVMPQTADTPALPAPTKGLDDDIDGQIDQVLGVTGASLEDLYDSLRTQPEALQLFQKAGFNPVDVVRAVERRLQAAPVGPVQNFPPAPTAGQRISDGLNRYIAAVKDPSLQPTQKFAFGAR